LPNRITPKALNMSTPIQIAACQFLVREVRDFKQFADHVNGLLDQAKDAILVLLPELFTTELFTTLPDWRKRPFADLIDIDRYTDDYRQFFTNEASRRGQYIVAGSHLMRKDGAYYNVGHLFAPGGLVHQHVKTHIFPAESDWSTQEGDEMQVLDLPFAKVGFNICYEAEIPECSASLAEQGAEIILCPSDTFTEYGFWRVRHCAQARAIENQIYFVHCCLGGGPGSPLPNGWARSSIISPCDVPWKNASGVIAEANPNKEMVIRGAVDLDVLRENREKGAATTFKDRRRRASIYANWPSHLAVHELAPPVSRY
jgi:predicted amidohydrolase